MNSKNIKTKSLNEKEKSLYRIVSETNFRGDVDFEDNSYTSGEEKKLAVYLQVVNYGKTGFHDILEDILINRGIKIINAEKRIADSESDEDIYKHSEFSGAIGNLHYQIIVDAPLHKPYETITLEGNADLKGNGVENAKCKTSLTSVIRALGFYDKQCNKDSIDK